MSPARMKIFNKALETLAEKISFPKKIIRVGGEWVGRFQFFGDDSQRKIRSSL